MFDVAYPMYHILCSRHIAVHTKHVSTLLCSNVSYSNVSKNRVTSIVVRNRSYGWGERCAYPNDHRLLLALFGGSRAARTDIEPYFARTRAPSGRRHLVEQRV